MPFKKKKAKKKEVEFYSFNKLIKKCPEAKYYMVFSKRSNGKTYDGIHRILEDYVKSGYSHEGVYIRRHEKDIAGKAGERIFKNLECNKFGVNEVERLTDGKFDRIIKYGRDIYLARYDEELDKNIKDSKPFCHMLDISTAGSTKSQGYPFVYTIFFDEFIDINGFYLLDEFVLFMNLISTVVRQDAKVTIFMAANAVSPYCPYFREMGLKHVRDMKAGDIDIYEYDKGLRVAVEYAASEDGEEVSYDSDMYFAFDNPKLNMITKGTWAINSYPHRPVKFTIKDILFTYFIKFEENIYQCEWVLKGNDYFTFIHVKTTDFQKEEKDLIYDTEPSSLYMHSNNILAPKNDLERHVKWFFEMNRVFYQDNEVGEGIMNYLNWCKQH